jgi:hypothetical protein
MTDTTTQSKIDAELERARRDLLIAGGVAAAVMIAAALFAPAQHLWGVALGAFISLANLSALARIGASLLGGGEVAPIVAIKAVAKLFLLMIVVIAVLYTRPHLAFGLCIGLALPAVAGILLALSTSARRARIKKALTSQQSRD